MDVFEYNKCLLTRLEESQAVLKCTDSRVTASDVKSQWEYYAECYIEPAGWQALWSIPRLICEELDIKYPTTVFGVVEDVLFADLKAIFTVLAVDEVIELPKSHEVNLIDLWPTKNQENDALNAETTAECIDKIRFFYNHIWMPWDSDADDDMNWVEKHLDSRIRFYFDLKRKDVKRCVAAHIRTLILEAKYIQNKREYLEMDLSDEETNVDEVERLDESHITDLMRLHFRLTMIKSQLEILENPMLRKIYENVMFDNHKYLKHALEADKKELRRSLQSEKVKVYIVTAPCRLAEQLGYLERAKQIIPEEKLVQMCKSFMDVLDFCSASDQIYLPPGTHVMKFLEYFNDDGLIYGLSSNIRYSCLENDNLASQASDVIITTQDADSILFIFDGNFTLKNLVLDCRIARCGVMVKSGTVVLENCLILGDAKSSTKQGLVVCGVGKLSLKGCLVKNLSQGIVVQDQGELQLEGTTIFNCRYGLQVEDGVKVELGNTTFSQAKNCGIYYITNCLNNKVEQKRLVYDELYAMASDLCESLPWTGQCSFKDTCQNIILVNKQASLVSQRIEDMLSEDMEDIKYTSFQQSVHLNGNDSENSYESAESEVIDVEDDDESVFLVE